MGKYSHINYNKETIIRKIPVDTDRLYGDIDTAISYLKEIKDNYPDDVSLYEDWVDYEYMTMCFSFSERETDQEWSERIRRLEYEHELRVELQQQKEKIERTQKKNQYEKLKKELGYC